MGQAISPDTHDPNTDINAAEGFRFYIHRNGTTGASCRVDGGYVSFVVADYEHRGEGLGTELMEFVTFWAETHAVILTLHCRNELIPWYERFGFVFEDKDPWGNRMVREL
jgi:GNAT superfamily N-acetyltransferase